MNLADAVHLAGLPQPAARIFLRECAMTLPERERHLYMTGRTVEADLIAQQIESEEAAIVELREERDDLQKTIDRMEREAREFEAAVEAAEEKVLTLTTDLENTQDELRVARAQIHSASLDLL